MRFKRPIYRILFYAAWIVVIGGIVTLLIAASGKSKTRSCKGVAVSINNGGDRIYVEKEDVLKSIEKTVHGSVVKMHTGDINLALLEKNLEKNPWIRDAELYFDTRDLLHVAISERVPMARVFATNGNSFYLDSAGCQMPLLETYSARLPVVTGFTAAKRWNAADSALLKETKDVIETISADPFWNAQVGQIDITPERKFELVPVIGSHVIRLGSGTGVKEKLARLMVFYKQVLPKAGFAKYSALDLQFDGQVVAVQRGPVSSVDSIQLQKNIQELLAKKMAEQEPDEMAPVKTEAAVLPSGDVEEPMAGTSASEKPEAAVHQATPAAPSTPLKKPVTTPKPAPKKTNVQSKPLQKPKAVKKAVRKPKAVMQRHVANEY